MQVSIADLLLDLDYGEETTSQHRAQRSTERPECYLDDLV